MMGTQRQSRISAGRLARIGVLGAIAAILFYFPEVPVIGFYKLDFSTLPALLGGFAMGPWAGLAIVLIKDLFGLLHSSSAMVGELADFLCSASIVLVASLIYLRHKTFKGALAGMVSGGVMVFVWKYGVRPLGGAWNIYELLPAFIVASVAIVAVSLATAPPAKEICDEFDSIGK